uniref:Uncharacterized protein n=1 Tax=Cacopsylla melanoneura TaxID=428564 RepID=A0A8D8RML0_9HEMI
MLPVFEISILPVCIFSLYLCVFLCGLAQSFPCHFINFHFIFELNHSLVILLISISYLSSIICHFIHFHPILFELNHSLVLFISISYLSSIISLSFYSFPFHI